jgi:predicted DNA-binding transcriptional regulator YafY
MLVPEDDDHDKISSLGKGLWFYDLLDPDRWQSSRELGQSIGVDSRTIKSYARTFMAYGWPVKGRNGKGRGYKLDSPALHGIRLSSRDLFSLAILLAQGSSSLPRVEAERLKSKLKALLPKQTSDDLTELEELVAVQGFAPKDWDLVEHVGVCLRDRHYSLFLDYQPPNAPSSRRHALPVQIRPQKGIWYLDVFDLEKQVSRSFRFDRILGASLHRQDRPYAEPPGQDFQTHKWDFGNEEPKTVTLEVTNSLAAWLKENPEHPSQQLSNQEQRNLVTYTVRRLDLFADWTLSLRGARVEGPMELQALIHRRARDWLGPRGSMDVEWEK